MKVAKGTPAPGVFKYLNEIDALCNLKSSVTTVDQFLEIGHLENCLAVKAAYMVKDVSRKMASAKEKKIIKVNEMFTQDISLSVRAHMLYLSFYIFKLIIDTTEFKD